MSSDTARRTKDAAGHVNPDITVEMFFIDGPVPDSVPSR